jgi:hypothetical protein
VFKGFKMTILDIENSQVKENLSKVNNEFKKDVENLKSFQQELKDEINKITKDDKKEIKCNS